MTDWQWLLALLLVVPGPTIVLVLLVLGYDVTVVLRKRPGRRRWRDPEG